MITDHLSQKKISIEKIFLDPNNPRFWSQQTRSISDVPDHKIPDAKHQARALDNISTHGIEDLKNSILRNGFLPLDRIVVRKLDGVSDSYVVVEGNRRLASLTLLREQISDGTLAEDLDESYLNDLMANTAELDVLVYEGESNKDIAWLLQGVRHISGIRDWEPAQQGKLVADQIDKKGLQYAEAGQRFGLSAQKVGRRYRSYKALEQMRQDDDFQNKAENKYYSLFEEAIGKVPVRQWLGWNDNSFKFENTDRIKQFYSWICPDEENENKRRIHDPRHIKILGSLISDKQDQLIEKIDNYDITIEAAGQRHADTHESFDLDGSIERVVTTLKAIPNSAISDDSAKAIALLRDVKSQVEAMMKMAESVTHDDLEQSV